MGSTKISTIDLEEPVVEALNTIDTVADQITDMSTDVDSIKGTVESNNTLLNNATYGLNALKTAIDGVNTAVSSSGGKLLKVVRKTFASLNNETMTDMGLTLAQQVGFYAAVAVSGWATYSTNPKGYFDNTVGRPHDSYGYAINTPTTGAYPVYFKVWENKIWAGHASNYTAGDLVIDFYYFE